MNRLRRALLLALLLTLLPSAALAAPAQDPEPAAPGLWMDAQGTNLRIAGMKAAATVCWFVEKAVAGLTRLFVTEQPWASVQEAMLTSLRDQMPTILHGLLFSGSGTGGLVYLALMLAGLCLVMPFFGAKPPVDTARVLTWSVIVVTLFISATAGYDLLGLIEEMRSSTVTTILDGDAGDLDALVARPMRAGDEDLADYRFVLPEDFEEEYFPQPDEDAYEEFTILWAWHIYVESSDSQAERQERAATGLALALLTLVPGVVLALFGLVLAALAAGALVLILFFVVSLPLALFDFGGLILRGIGQQYLYLCALTLLAAVIAALLLETSALAWPTGDAPDPQAMMLYLPVLLTVALALGYVARLATGALWSSLGTVGSGMQQAASSLAPGRVAAPGIVGSGLAAGTASTLATTALAGLAGGPTAALVAGAGSLLSQISPRAGQGAAQLVSAATGGSDGAKLFAAAARGGGVVGATSQLLHQRQRDAKASGQAATRAHSRTSAQPAQRWGAHDAGAYRTTDVRHLDAAEAAYDAGRTIEARTHLERALGSRQVAEQALGLYTREGAAGQRRVRGIARATQEVAAGLAQGGQRPFDHQGQATPAFQAAVQYELQRGALLPADDPAAAAVAGEIAGASVRRPVGIWADPAAARELARATLYPQEPTPVTSGDLSAQYRLHQLAGEQGWNEADLETLYEAAHLGQGAAVASGRPAAQEASALLAQQGTWEAVSPPLRQEASRLALLAARDAQAERGVRLEFASATPVAMPAGAGGAPVSETPIPAPPNPAAPERSPHATS